MLYSCSLFLQHCGNFEDGGLPSTGFGLRRRFKCVYNSIPKLHCALFEPVGEWLLLLTLLPHVLGIPAVSVVSHSPVARINSVRKEVGEGGNSNLFVILLGQPNHDVLLGKEKRA